MPYAVPDDAVDRFGQQRLLALLPEGVAEQEDRLAGALLEGEGEIDAALSAAGISAPVNLAAIPAGEQRDRAAALLRRLAVGLAIEALSRGADDVPKPIAAEAAWARGLLAKLTKGEMAIPGLAASGRGWLVVSPPAVPDEAVLDRLAGA